MKEEISHLGNGADAVEQSLVGLSGLVENAGINLMVKMERILSTTFSLRLYSPYPPPIPLTAAARRLLAAVMAWLHVSEI